jgi:hypothetical protein
LDEQRCTWYFCLCDYFFNIGLRIKTCHNWSIWGKKILKLILLINCKFCLNNISWLTKLFVMWKVRTQICVQWYMFLNKLFIVKNWGYWHHLKVIVLVVFILQFANMPFLMRR